MILQTSGLDMCFKVQEIFRVKLRKKSSTKTDIFRVKLEKKGQLRRISSESSSEKDSGCGWCDKSYVSLRTLLLDYTRGEKSGRIFIKWVAL